MTPDDKKEVEKMIDGHLSLLVWMLLIGGLAITFVPNIVGSIVDRKRCAPLIQEAVTREDSVAVAVLHRCTARRPR